MEFDNKYLEETLSKAIEDKDYFYIPKGLTRYDFGNSHGWWVRVERDQAKFHQFFSDGKYGSPEEAIVEAIKFRHEVISSFPLGLRRRKGTKRALSPEPEKRISRCVDKGKQQPYTYWKATWYDENYKVKNRSFSVIKFTEQGAKKLALAEATKSHNYKPKEETLVKPSDPYSKQKYRKMSREDVDVLASINTRENKTEKKEEIIEIEDLYGYEGDKRYVAHLAVERDKGLRNKKIIEFLKINDELFCEVCGFNFSKCYSFLNHNIIEVHHIKPLSSLLEKTKVSIEDLMLLCSNCHFAVHQGDCQKNLALMITEFKKIMGSE
jgi:predicted HNH restriction endonuclease